MDESFQSTYDLLAPRRVAFGWGRVREAGALARSLGRRALVVHGSRALERAGVVGELVEILEREGLETVVVGSISREPEVEDVDRMAGRLRELAAGAGDVMVALGGGSAIDLAKASAAMATNRQGSTVRDYLEGVGRGLSVREDPLPLLALPTTAGTGSEATKNAVISGREPPFKKSIRSDRMVPAAVLVDPRLTASVPPAITAATGMDAITQLIESYISLKARPIPRALALQGIALAVPSLPLAFRDGSDRGARERMAHAAFLSGIALANSGLGLAHGVAAALGIHAGAPHGLACAVLLPVALRVNRDVRREDLARLAEEACGRRFEDGAPEALIDEIERLCEAVGIPRRLSALGVRRDQLPAIVASSRGSSMSGNPREVSDGELADVLESVL